MKTSENTFVWYMLLLPASVCYSLYNYHYFEGFFLYFIFWHFLLVSGVEVALHRYFSHKSFKTSRIFQFVLAVWGGLAIQAGPLFWASRHRHHHKHCDQGVDIHSPIHGFYTSHCGWLFKDSTYTNNNFYEKFIPDLLKFRELYIFEDSKYMILVVLGIHYILAGWKGCVIGLVANFTSFHCIQVTNSVDHLYGYKNDKNRKGCDARNCFWTFPLQLGGNWHANHHYNSKMATTKIKWWEIDIWYWIILIFESLGLIWDVEKLS